MGFQRQAAALVLDPARTSGDAGRKVCVNHETLRNWLAGCGTSATVAGPAIWPLPSGLS